MPLSFFGNTAPPDGRKLGAGAHLAVNGEADLFQLVSQVVPHESAFIFGTDEPNDHHRAAVELPFAIRVQCGAHGFHFSDNDFLALLEEYRRGGREQRLFQRPAARRLGVQGVRHRHLRLPMVEHLALEQLAEGTVFRLEDHQLALEGQGLAIETRRAGGLGGRALGCAGVLDAGTAQAAVAVGILLQIILVIVLGRGVVLQRGDLRGDLAQAALGQVRRGGAFGIYGVDEFGKALIDPFKARGPFRWQPNEYDEAEAHGRVVDFVLSGKLDAGLWMDLEHPYPLARIGEAYASLRRKEAIKILIDINFAKGGVRTPFA